MEIVSKHKLENAVLLAKNKNFAQPYKIAECSAEIVVTEKSKTIRLGGNGTEFTVKSFSAAIVICDNMKYAENINVNFDFFGDIESFELRFNSEKVRNKEYMIEVSYIKNMTPVEIDLNGQWRFDVTDHLDTIKGFFPDLIFD